LVNPGDQVDERAFAGAVFAHQCVDLAGSNLEVDGPEHRVTGERLGKANGAERGRRVPGVGDRHVVPGEHR